MEKLNRLSRVRIPLAAAVVIAGAVWVGSRIARNTKMQANEAESIAALRTLNTAEVTYTSTYNSGFTDNLRKLGVPPTTLERAVFREVKGGSTDLLNTAVWETDNPLNFRGYKFVYAPGGRTTVRGPHKAFAEYRLTADPIQRGHSGPRSFVLDHSGVLRANATRPATARDTPYDPDRLGSSAVSENERLAARFLAFANESQRIHSWKSTRKWEGFFCASLKELAEWTGAPWAERGRSGRADPGRYGLRRHGEHFHQERLPVPVRGDRGLLARSKTT